MKERAHSEYRQRLNNACSLGGKTSSCVWAQAPAHTATGAGRTEVSPLGTPGWGSGSVWAHLRAHPRAHPQPHPCLQLAAGARHLRVPHMQVFRRASSTSFSAFHRHTCARFSFDPINYYYRKVVSIRHEIFSFGMILSLQLMLLPSFNISLKSFSMWINIIQMQVICRINSTLHKENYWQLLHIYNIMELSGIIQHSYYCCGAFHTE